MSKYFTGIGSRETPKEICSFMSVIGETLANKGYILRSGGADGADKAFHDGSKNKSEIYLPWNGFNGLKESKVNLVAIDFENWDEAWEMMIEIHPAWDKLSAGAQSLHTRNIYQVLGRDLNTPSKVVIYWAKEDGKGKVSGGTATAVNLARKLDIPCYNLVKQASREKIMNLIGINND